MLNTLRRRGQRQQKQQRPALLSYKAQESQHCLQPRSAVAGEPSSAVAGEPRRSLPNLQCERTKELNYYQHFTQDTNVSNKYSNEQAQLGTKNECCPDGADTRVPLNRKQSIDSQFLKKSKYYHCNSSFVPKEDARAPLLGNLVDYHVSRSFPPRPNYTDNCNTSSDYRSHNDSRYDQEQLEPLPRRRSLVRKQNSFRHLLGYPLGGSVYGTSNNDDEGTLMGIVGRSVGGVVKRRKHVVLLGLDGAGKTTILLRLKYRCFVATAPTVGFNHEKVWGGGFRWSAWDVGGGERLRPLWGTYTRGTDAIVFVVDASAGVDAMEEARLELARIVKLTRTTATQLSRALPPLLVLANFQDRTFARNAPEVARCLSLPQEGRSSGVASQCWAVACVCGITGEGLDEALATLRHLLDSGGAAASSQRSKRWR